MAMRLSDRTDFGLRILITLAAAGGRRLSARELARAHRLSFSHVQKVIQHLDAAGFVDTFRGRAGGVTLARPPADVSVGDVVRALEPDLDLVRCLGPGESGCIFDGRCALTTVIENARSAFLAELDRSSLADLIRPGVQGLVQMSLRAG
jgi:Rrf2 family nitric oxide-sensitive transcriptional repressor